MKPVAPLVAAFLLLTSSASAMTGAELLDADERFARGYIFGMAEYRFMVAGPEDVDLAVAFGQCMTNAKVTSKSLYDAVVHYIRSNPVALAENAAGPVVRVFVQICPSPK
jgi:hypothetical protein